MFSFCQLLEGITDMLEKRGTAKATTRPPMPSNETVTEQVNSSFDTSSEGTRSLLMFASRTLLGKISRPLTLAWPSSQRRKELVRQMCKGGGYCPYAEPSGKKLLEKQ